METKRVSKEEQLDTSKLKQAELLDIGIVQLDKEKLGMFICLDKELVATIPAEEVAGFMANFNETALKCVVTQVKMRAKTEGVNEDALDSLLQKLNNKNLQVP